MNKKALIAIISGVSVVVIGGVLATVLYILPKSHYDKGSDLYRSGSFGAAKVEFDAAGNFRDAKECAVASDKQQALLDGNTAMTNGEYEKARELFIKAGEYDLNSINLNLAEEMITGKEVDALMEEGKYIEASDKIYESGYSQPDRDAKLSRCCEALVKADDLYNAYVVTEHMKDGQNQRFYVEGRMRFNEGKYDNAKTYFESSNYLDSKDYVKDCIYHLGVGKYDGGSYIEALKYFNQLNSMYKDTEEYAEKSTFMCVTEYIEKGDYVNAKVYLDRVDENYELGDLKASDLRAQLDKYSDYYTMCDAWHCVDGKMKTEEKWSYYNSWWEVTGDDLKAVKGYQYIALEMNFKVNEDGTVTLSGSTKLTFFEDFSSVKALLDIKEEKYTFNETVKSSSGSIKVSDEVTLKYGKDKCTVNYRKEDNPYTGCKHIMTSEFVFEHR